MPSVNFLTLENKGIVGSKLWKILPLFIFLIFPYQQSKTDCGVQNAVRLGKTYSFFHAENLNFQSDYAPYLLGYGVMSNFILLEKREAYIDDNIKEWQGRFCGKPDSADVDILLYDSSIDEIAELRAPTSSKKKDMYYTLETNTFAQIIVENSCVEVVDYLLFAKRCEPYCVKGELWSDKPKDVAQMFLLINQGRDLFRNTKSPFLKLRYAYQIIRLAHYAKDYKAVIQIYDDVVFKMEHVNSVVKWWILAHRAGALKALGQRAQAAYLFAVVFQNSPSKRRQAFESFDVKTAQEWRDCLNLCRNNSERAALYAIRASYDKAKALEDLKAIYALDPNNEHLELLLSREVLRLEKLLLGHSFRSLNYDVNIINKNKSYCTDLKAFVKQIADEGTVKKSVFWRTTEGYLEVLLGESRNAMRTFAQARMTNKDAVLGEQIETFSLAARIMYLQVTDITLNDEIKTIRESDIYLGDDDFDDFFIEKIGSLYKDNGDKGTAFLCNYSLSDLEKAPKLNLLDDLIALCRKPNKSFFEKEMTTTGKDKTIESQIWQLKGRYHLARFQLEAAAEAFKNVPETERGKKYTPFIDKIKDCVTCVQSDTILVDKYEFVQRMLSLEYQIKAGQGDVSRAYYLLGLGFYNMTYFGNSSGLTDAYRSGVSWKYLNSGREVYELSGFPLGNAEVTDVLLASEYFEKARQFSSDREFQARCAFWIAKCEQNQFFTNKESRYNIGGKTKPNVPPQYRRYFKLMKDYYSDTQFYRQAATECKYFGFYISK
jgi:hypothetical protein